METFPRPYTTLLISGWDLVAGQVAKEGIVRVSESDDPEGAVVIADCLFQDLLFSTDVRTPEQMAAMAVSLLILSRYDVQEILASERVGEGPLEADR